MKISELKKEDKGIIDRKKLLNILSGGLPDTAIERVIRKIKKEYPAEKIHSACAGLDYTTCEPSSLGMVACVKIYQAYIKSSKASRHPVHIIDTLTQTNDVVVTRDALLIQKEDKGVEIIPLALGLFTANPTDRLTALTSTALAFVTHKGDKGYNNIFEDSRKCILLRVPKIDAVAIRSVCEVPSRSGNSVRDEIFTLLKEDTNHCQVVSDLLYGVLPYKNVSERVRLARVNIAAKFTDPKGEGESKPSKMEGNMPMSAKRTYEFAEDPALKAIVAACSIANSTIGGTGKGRGSLSIGYMFGEISSAWSKVIVAVRTIKRFCAMSSVFVVNLSITKEINIPVIRTLIRNGISVVSSNGKGYLKDPKTTPGHFMVSALPSITIINDPFTHYTFTKKGIEWNDKEFDSEYEVLKHLPHNIWFCHTIISPKLKVLIEQGMLFYYPSLKPHECKIWISNVDMGQKINYRRILASIYSKVSYPFHRRPFVFDDVDANKFEDRIYLPKIVRSEKLDETQYKVDMSETVELEKLECTVESVYGPCEYQPPAKIEEIDVVENFLVQFRNITDQEDRVITVSAFCQREEYKKYIERLKEDNEFYDCFEIYQKVRVTDDVGLIIDKDKESTLDEKVKKEEQPKDVDIDDYLDQLNEEMEKCVKEVVIK